MRLRNAQVVLSLCMTGLWVRDLLCTAGWVMCTNAPSCIRRMTLVGVLVYLSLRLMSKPWRSIVVDEVYGSAVAMWSKSPAVCRSMSQSILHAIYYRRSCNTSCRAGKTWQTDPLLFCVYERCVWASAAIQYPILGIQGRLNVWRDLGEEIRVAPGKQPNLIHRQW